MSKIGLQIDNSLEAWRQRPHSMRRPVERRPKVKGRPSRRQSSRKDSEMHEGNPNSKKGTSTNESNQKVRMNLDKDVAALNGKNLSEMTTEMANIDQNCMPKECSYIRPYQIRRAVSENKEPGEQLRRRKRNSKKTAPKEQSAKRECNGIIHAQRDKIDAGCYREDVIERPRVTITSTGINRGRKKRRKDPNKLPQPRPRAMSCDDVYRKKRAQSAHAFNQLINPCQSEVTIETPDTGSQIISNYSNSKQYNYNSPKVSRAGRVKSFFRRLAGSFESLLKIGQRSRSRHSLSNMENSYTGGSYNNPLFANYSPYITIDDNLHNQVPTEDSENMQIFAGNYVNDTPSLGEPKVKKDAAFKVADAKSSEISNSRKIAFSRGKRVYLSPGEQTGCENMFYRAPVPPKLSGTKHRKKSNSVVRKSKIRTFRISYDGYTPNLADSYDWETRSDTDSDRCAFRSDNLRLAGITFPSASDSDEVVKVAQSLRSDNEVSDTSLQALLPDYPEGSNLVPGDSGPARGKLAIPAKISDFGPPGDATQNHFEVKLSEQRIHRQSGRSIIKGPLKALRSQEIQSIPVRAESVGKFDVPRCNTNRKVRRRNSSFFPGNSGDEKQASFESNLKEAASFEQIMNSINEMANSLDQVRIRSHSDLRSNEHLNKPSNNDYRGEVDFDNKQAVTGLSGTQHHMSRQESWVGAVSTRLDKLIATNGDKVILPPRDIETPNIMPLPEDVENFKHHTREHSNTHTEINHTRRSNSTAIRREKISFDDLENDFKDFAREIRQRERQSLEKLDTVKS